jgi:hypothetical protein
MTPLVKAIITITGTDATFVADNLLSLTYKESIGHDGGVGAMGDTVDLEFCDPGSRFRLSWSIANASQFNLTLVTGGETTVVGSMTVKEIRMGQSKTKGTTIRLSATSVPVDTSVRLEKKSRAWENTDLQTIAQQIATDNKLTLRYMPKDNPKIARADEHDHSDSYLLAKLCSEHDFVPKIKDGILTIRDYKDVESGGPVGTFICPTKFNTGGLNGKGIENWEFCDSLEDCYSECEFSWKDPKDGTTAAAKAIDVNMNKDAPHLVYHYTPRPGVPQQSGEEVTLF